MSTKVRINITVDRETLQLADQEARRRRTSRSEFIRTAVRTLGTKDNQAAQEAERRERRDKAFQAIRRIAKQMGNWPAGKIVHDWRYRLRREAK